MYRLEFTIPGLPKTSNSHYAHWAVAGGERKKWRRASYLITRSNAPKKPLKRCKIECTRVSLKEPDFDNLAFSFKSIIDGLKDAGIIEDDKSSCVVERKYLWEKCSPKNGYVKIVVEEVE